MKPEAVVVLGAAQYDGRPSRILRARLDEALRVPAACPIVTVGGKLPGDRFTEAEVGKSYLEKAMEQASTTGASRIPPRHVYAVATGTDTRGSLEAVLEAYPYRSVVIVTDPLHRLRTYLIARKMGFHPKVLGVKNFDSSPRQGSWWRYLAHECGGLLVLGVEHVFSASIAQKLRSRLHRIEGWMKPSRRRRHAVILKQDKKL